MQSNNKSLYQNGLRVQRIFANFIIIVRGFGFVAYATLMKIFIVEKNLKSMRIKYLACKNRKLSNLTPFPLLKSLQQIKEVHCQSRNMNEEVLRDGMNPVPKTQAPRRPVVFAWMTQQSIAEETIIFIPHILEFLEQTLEPIPSTIPQPKSNTSNTMFAMDLDTNVTSTVTNYAYTSFPVDVIVTSSCSRRHSASPVCQCPESSACSSCPHWTLFFSSKRAEVNYFPWHMAYFLLLYFFLIY
jgi:hypothetical protein